MRVFLVEINIQISRLSNAGFMAGPRPLESLSRTKRLLLPPSQGTARARLPGTWGVGFSLLSHCLFLGLKPAHLGTKTPLSVLLVQRPRTQTYTCGSPESPGCHLTLRISRLGGLHNHMRQLLMTNLFIVIYLHLVLFLWRTLTNTNRYHPRASEANVALSAS